MHMLSAMGSRLMEADQLGLGTAQQMDEQESSEERGGDSMTSSIEVEPTPEADRFFRRPGIASELFDDQSECISYES